MPHSAIYTNCQYVSDAGVTGDNIYTNPDTGTAQTIDDNNVCMTAVAATSTRDVKLPSPAPKSTAVTRLLVVSLTLTCLLVVAAVALGVLLNSEIADLDSRVSDLVTQQSVQSELVSDLRREISKQAATIQHLSQTQGKAVYFTAGIQSNITVNTRNKVKFTHVITDIGGGYSPTIGVFTCPESGVYLFTVHAMNQYNKFVSLLLMHNDQRVVYLHADDDQHYNTGSNSAILSLAQGDTVSVEADELNSYIYGDNYPHTTFSGALLHVT